jgi:hypothetical protein
VIGHIERPTGLPAKGDTAMRKLMISAATAAALVTAFSVRSAVAVLEQSYFATAPNAQRHLMHIADAGHVFRHGHMPLFTP